MLLNQTVTASALMQTPGNAICRHYLRNKLTIRLLIRHAKRLVLKKPAFAYLQILVAGLLVYTATAHAENLTKNQTVMPVDLIELLGDLGDDEADLEAAMSSIHISSIKSNSNKKPPQTKPISTQNSNAGTKK